MKGTPKKVYSFQKFNQNSDQSYNNIQQLKSHIDSNFAVITELFLNLYHIKSLSDSSSNEHLSLKSPIELISYIKNSKTDFLKEQKEFRTTSKAINDRILSLSSKMDYFDKTLNENITEMNQQIQNSKIIPGLIGKFQKYKSFKDYITISDNAINQLTYTQKKIDANLKINIQKLTDNLKEIEQKFEEKYEQLTKLVNSNIKKSETKLLTFFNNLSDEISTVKDSMDIKSNIMKKNIKEEINKNFEEYKSKMLGGLKEDGDSLNLIEFVEKKINQILESNNIHNRIKEKKNNKKTALLGKGKKLDLNLINFTPQNKNSKMTPIKNNKSIQNTEEILSEKKNAFFRSSGSQKKLFTSNSQILRSNKISLTKKMDSLSLSRVNGKLFEINDELQNSSITKDNEKLSLPKVQIRDINQKNKFKPILYKK